MGIQIGLVSSDNKIVEKVIEIIKTIQKNKKNEYDYLSLVHLKNFNSAFDFVNFEFPDYLILNYNDNSIEVINLLKIINNDPWFHTTGIILIVDYSKQRSIPDELTSINVLSFINLHEIDYYLAKILDIILSNKQVVVQKDLAQTILEKRSGSFILDNDPSMVSSYVNIITSSLVSEKYINPAKETALRIALTELIMNAIEHGNCEISYDEKTAFLENGGDINELIKKKTQDPEIAKRKVYFDYTFTNDYLTFVIRDCGKGFDHKKRVYNPDKEEDLWQMHGRGIFMTKMYVDSLTYNDIGNEATIVVKTDRDKKTVPEGFLSQKELVFKPGDVVFRQGDKSNNLYYIVNCVYYIIMNGKKIAQLDPKDIFLGEMSFLLSNKRVATVIAKTEGKLIEIPKKSFINIIKKYPHYGLFLSKLLAQRLELSNTQKFE